MCVLRPWGFKKTWLLYPFSHSLDLLVYRDLHFHGNFTGFPIKKSTGSLRQTVLWYSEFTTIKLPFWCHHFSICHPEWPRFQETPLWPTNPNHSCYLACLDAAPTGDAFALFREPPPPTLSNLSTTASSSTKSLSSRDVTFFGS